MALPTATHSTYASIGNREDLSDVIWRVDPTDTPFSSSLERTDASAVNHEWQTQALASASTSNAVLEGDDAITDAATATVRLGNICQIQDKVARVSGTQEVIKKAGRSNEMAYQLVLKGLELKLDVEATLLTNQAKVTGNSTTARKLASVCSWITTNTSNGGGSDATGDGTDARTDGTQRAYTESLLKTVLQLCWNSGGNPGTIMLGGFNKQQMSMFVGRGTPTEDAKSKKIVATVDVYESDFGTLKVVPNRSNLRTRDCLILQNDMWALATLRDMATKDLAITGDSKRKQIIMEHTLECRNEKASGAVWDLTTS